MTRMNERQVSNLSAPTNHFGGAFAKRLLPMGLAAFLRGLATFSRGLAPVAMVAAASVPAMAADAPQPGNPQVAEAVAALRAITAMKADFVQSDSNGGSVRGTVYLKRPGKIRFQYQPGYPMTILSDGHALFMIDKEVNQTQRWPINNSPLGALLDPNKDVARFARLVPTNDANVIAIEAKDRMRPEYGTMTLVFRRKPAAPGGLELESWTTRDAQNRQTRIALSGHQYNVSPSEDLFRYTDTRARPHK